MEISHVIEQFLDLCNKGSQIYGASQATVEKYNKIDQDFLHAIELANLNYKQRAKLTTEAKNNRVQRRLAKDVVEVYAPLMEYLAKPENFAAIQMLKQVLGAIRKQEQYHQNRTYIKKV